MSGPVNVSPPRGMRDLLPDEVELRDWAQGVILDTYTAHGFRHVETPALESIALLTGGGGGENEKLIFKVLKRGEKLDFTAARSEDDLVEYGLRFDLTVPLARYYAANHAQLSQPFKAIQIGPVWRAERPQKGRFRQFTQCDIDVLGEAGESAEAELILATTAALAALGLTAPQVRLNDRRLLRRLAAHCGVNEPAAQERFFITLDKLDKLGPGGVLKELREHPELATSGMWDRLTSVLDGSSSWTLADFAARIDGAADAEPLTRILAAVGAALGGAASVAFDATLVRGMGYYTGPIFEIGVEGLPYSIAGGGRYDRMIGALIGRDVPACGFSIGFERVIALLQERGVRAPRGSRRVALLHEAGTDALGTVLAAAAALRAQGHTVSLTARRRKAGKQLDELQKQGFDGAASLTAVGGEPEVKWFAGP